MTPASDNWRVDDRVACHGHTPAGKVLAVGGNWLKIRLDTGLLAWELMANCEHELDRSQQDGGQ